MYSGHLARPTRAQVLLTAATFASYGVGYPLAIIADYAVGWVLVTLGGVFLLLLLGVTARRITAAPSSEPARTDSAPASHRVRGAGPDVP